LQAGGRRFDPVQLHQTVDGPRDVPAVTESRSKRQHVPFASGLLNQRYRLFFNNAEEVKQVLLDVRGGRAQAFSPAPGARWVGLYRPAVPLVGGGGQRKRP
jgi:hypothetical protein